MGALKLMKGVPHPIKVSWTDQKTGGLLLYSARTVCGLFNVLRYWLAVKIVRRGLRFIIPDPSETATATGDGDEKVTSECSFALSSVFRDYSALFSLNSMGQVS